MTQVCDTCLTAVYDEPMGTTLTGEEQAEMAIELGADIADHRCDQFENGDPCACACYGGPTEKSGNYQSPQGFSGKRMGQSGDGFESGFSRGGGLSGKGSI